jgi:hypothetical protein
MCGHRRVCADAVLLDVQACEWYLHSYSHITLLVKTGVWDRQMCFDEWLQVWSSWSGRGGRSKRICTH